ncbi:ThuA domain-containing protein [Rhodopila sp.]|jgi:type 1 glutamine amidotransferase|uniref:ThuA domain-containing protein n=1 Tax=Rhodopila sp. TaxID=2480087 RepID=UPI002C7B7295|nr:ThuA domain-containing protein [Rhodopila sp.]HVZ09095.1 ThuA domain-containing protein [Rhodopila sp.]
MADKTPPRRAHLITGGFPPGSPAGHDHDYARLRLLGILAERDVPASAGNDFADLSRWLPLSRLLVTYVAGPFPDPAQCGELRAWLDAGGHWLALHGTSGGKAERVEGLRQRRTVRMPHHALLGSLFLTHPPLCRFQVDVADGGHPVTQGLSASFVVEDEPYFIALQDPASVHLLLTATYTDAAATSPAVGPLYGGDTSLLTDGRTRAIAYVRPVGRGAVIYCALGHCHSPAARPGPRDPTDTMPATVLGAWQSDAFATLLDNAVTWALRA